MVEQTGPGLRGILTKKQHDFLLCAALGLDEEQISNLCGIPVEDVLKQRQDILLKFDVELVRDAIAKGFWLGELPHLTGATLTSVEKPVNEDFINY